MASADTPRIQPVNPDDMTPGQAKVFEAIASGPRGVVRGPLAIWLHRPELATHAQALGAYCRYGSSLPPRLSELAILLTAQMWRAGYEWEAHAPAAKEGGLSDEVIEALRLGQVPDFEREDEALVYAFAKELLSTHRVTDTTYNASLLQLGEEALVDLVGVLGYYGLISMTINAFQLPIRGTRAPFD